jgi:hypothetical protein
MMIDVGRAGSVNNSRLVGYPETIRPWNLRPPSQRDYPRSAGCFAARFFGSTCVFPVSSQSTDLPNSRLIVAQTAPPDEDRLSPLPASVYEIRFSQNGTKPRDETACTVKHNNVQPACIRFKQSEPSAQGASNFLATELRDPFRAFTCTHKPYYGKVSHLPTRLGARLD